MTRYLLATAMLCLLAFPAHARHAHHHAGHHFKHHRVHHSGLWRHRSVAYRGVRHQRGAYDADQDGRWGAQSDQPSPDSRRHHRRIRVVSLGDGWPRGGRPRAWCGWFARSLVGSDPGPAYNLARNWAQWGRPASPGVGVMVVWSHHVGQITGRTSDGRWIVKSGNDGHAVRERPRSIAGAIAFRSG